ncbi:MAG: hypothetical protein K8S98_08440 [Planctomycetes bacterium]|nr:hypothetical protein [Planctomycetota bacterium]
MKFPRRPQPSKRRLTQVAGALLLTLAGCRGPGFGSRAVTVEVVTRPTTAIAYVVPEELWARDGKPRFKAVAAASDAAGTKRAREALLVWLEDFRVREKTRPARVSVVCHRQVLVACKGEQVDFLEFDPVACRQPMVELESNE